VFKIIDKKRDCIRMGEGAINKLISLRGRRGVTISEDFKDDRLP